MKLLPSYYTSGQTDAENIALEAKTIANMAKFRIKPAVIEGMQFSATDNAETVEDQLFKVRTSIDEL